MNGYKGEEMNKENKTEFEKMRESLFWRAGKYLPGLSLYYSWKRHGDENFGWKHFAAHMAYYATCLVAPFVWGVFAIATNTDKLCPVEQNQIYQQRERIDRRESELFEKVFGEKGLADRNSDGKLNLNEIADAYGRMGVKLEVYSEGRQQKHNTGKVLTGKGLEHLVIASPTLTIEDLEKAVQSYEDEQNRDSDSLRDQEVD